MFRLDYHCHPDDRGVATASAWRGRASSPFGWLAAKMAGDLLGVNEWHGSQYWSLVQLTSLPRSYEVSAGRRGCCTYPLYCS